MEKIKITIN